MSKNFNRKERIIMTMVIIFLNILRQLKFYFQKIFRRDIRNNLNRSSYDNLKPNKTCFVLGNGPSLKLINPAKLIEQEIFAVNFFYKNKWFKKLKSVNFLFTDPAFFNDCTKQKLSKLAIKEILTLSHYESVKKIIIPIHRKEQWLKQFDDDIPGEKMRYYYASIEFHGGKLKLPKPHHNFYKGQTVIINALLYAMSVGYKKIYLLGVDMTGFLEQYQEDSNFQEHSYNKSNTHIDYIDMSSEDNEFNLKIHGKMFEEFKYLKRIAKQNNIQIFNATPGGALDIFERVNFENIT